MKTIFTSVLILLFAGSISQGQNNSFATKNIKPEGFKTIAIDNSKTSLLSGITTDYATHDMDTIYSFLNYEDWWGSFLLSEVASDDCAGGTGTTDGGQYQRYDRGLPITADFFFKCLGKTEITSIV